MQPLPIFSHVFVSISVSSLRVSVADVNSISKPFCALSYLTAFAAQSNYITISFAGAVS